MQKEALEKTFYPQNHHFQDLNKKRKEKSGY